MEEIYDFHRIPGSSPRMSAGPFRLASLWPRFMGKDPWGQNSGRSKQKEVASSQFWKFDFGRFRVKRNVDDEISIPKFRHAILARKMLAEHDFGRT